MESLQVLQKKRVCNSIAKMELEVWQQKKDNGQTLIVKTSIHTILLLVFTLIGLLAALY